MRFVVSSSRVRFLNQAAMIGIVAVIGSGCSSDFARFDAEQYTASIESSQPEVDQSNPYPGDIDPQTTASISRPGVRSLSSSRISRPPYPSSSVNGVRPIARNNTYQPISAPAPERNYRPQPYPVAQPDPLAQPYPGTSPRQVKPVNKPVVAARKRVAPYRPPATREPAQVAPISNTPRIVRRQPAVDPITTSSIAPARPVVNSKPRINSNVIQAPNVRADVKPEVQKSRKSGWTGIGGTSIQVREGETLYNISKRYGVPVNALMKANNLSDANQVSAGQRIVVPTYIYSNTVPVSAPDNNPKTRAARSDMGMLGEVSSDKVMVPTKAPGRSYSNLNDRYKPGLAPMVATPPSRKNVQSDTSRYTVVSGDSLGAIAQKYSVRSSQIMAANGLTDSNIRIGQKLIIPASDKPAKRKVGLAPMRTDPVNTGSTPKPYTKPGKISTKAPARSGIDKFRWPATGRVLSKFGESKNGARNEGIDISVPEGTPVKATENGVVIYSGTELQDYGKMLLIRHDGGWVSAYAYNSRLNVNRGDKVRRGQTIARSGRTGKAKQPMVHFELRKDATPVNPQKYLR